ncbi:MAG: response regulator [Dehalococcoidia bacterium]
MDEHSILLVEDSPDDEALTILALQMNNIPNEVVVARDGVEALEHLFGPGVVTGQDGQDLPRVVLLDLKLPRLDGHEVLRRIREDPRTRLLPIVVLTTSSEQEDRVKAYSGGANSYVRKPVDFRHFTDTVAQLGSYWLQVNEPPFQ